MWTSGIIQKSHRLMPLYSGIKRNTTTIPQEWYTQTASVPWTIGASSLHCIKKTLSRNKKKMCQLDAPVSKQQNIIWAIDHLRGGHRWSSPETMKYCPKPLHQLSLDVEKKKRAKERKVIKIKSSKFSSNSIQTC